MNKLNALKYAIYGLISIILIIIILIIAILIINIATPQDEQQKDRTEKDCIQTEEINSIRYEACYDAFSKNIYLEIKNDNLIHATTKVKFSFFDYNPQTHEITAPRFNTSTYQKIAALRNPLSAEITLKSTPNQYCQIPKIIQIEYCSSELANNQEIELNLITQTNISNYSTTSTQSTSKLPINLVENDRIWESICKSEWSCGPWGTCIENLQKRDCTDNNQCQIPTQIPDRVKSCGQTCQENWECKWSECSNGKTVPTCTDLNSCGTTADKPTEISCTNRCTPDISCGEWSPCQATYDFLTLQGSDYALNGKRTRTCTDQNSCTTPSIEVSECLLTIDIYTTSFTKCAKEYIGIYNKLDNQLLANIEKNENKNFLNIDLSGDQNANYCDYCFDGILNGDEEQIDCGGSCQSCDNRKVDEEFSKNIIDKILDSIFKFFS